MEITDSKGNLVEGFEFDRYSSHDELLLNNAYYVESGKEVSDKELDYIVDNYYDALYDIWHDRQVVAAEFLMDAYKDGTYE